LCRHIPTILTTLLSRAHLKGLSEGKIRCCTVHLRRLLRVTQELPFNYNQRRIIPDLSPERARIVRSAGNRLAGALHIGH
jgi:hypothetical protein